MVLQLVIQDYIRYKCGSFNTKLNVYLQHIAYGLWQLKKYPESRQHFLQSCDGQGCGHMLVEFHLGRGYNSELDLFIAQTVLQYLCLKKLLEAANVFRTYTKNHPSIKSDPPFSLPLLNFLWLLLISIKVTKISYKKQSNVHFLDKSKCDCIHFAV